MAEIKICGITHGEEADVLNEMQVEYAGFVLYEKSRRYIQAAEAAAIFSGLNAGIKKTAVMVSPEPALLEAAERAGFDIVQIHGTVPENIGALTRLPVWQAVNLADIKESAQIKPADISSGFYAGVQAVLLDAKEYGSGKTFGWEGKTRLCSELKKRLHRKHRRLILAGGLNSANVEEGIRLFAPDIVDVSTGVEYADGGGKDPEKIREFVRTVRAAKPGPYA